MAKKRGNNEGSISRRRSGSWRAQVTIEGKRLSYGAKTKAECVAWLNRSLDQVNNGMDLLGGTVTLTDYLLGWIETVKIGLRLKTSIQYEEIVLSKIIPGLGTLKLKDLRQDRIERFYTNLVKQGVGTRTIRLTHAILHRALTKAVLSGVIFRNPASGATLPQIHHSEMKVLDERQVSQFLVASQKTHNKAFFHLAITTGLRMGELLGLKWLDLQWTNGTLYIRRQIQNIRGHGNVVCEPKTRSGFRTIKLGPTTLEILQDHFVNQKKEIVIAGQRWKSMDLIFPSTVGTPMNPSNIRREFNQVLEKAGLEHIRFHDLRHTAASIMLNHGIPVIVVSKILGHSRPSITLDIYGHLINEMQEEASKIMDDLVTPIQVHLAPIHKFEKLPK